MMLGRGEALSETRVSQRQGITASQEICSTNASGLPQLRIYGGLFLTKACLNFPRGILQECDKTHTWPALLYRPIVSFLAAVFGRERGAALLADLI